MKKIVSMLLIFVLIATAFSGCGKNDKKDNKSKNNKSEITSTEKKDPDKEEVSYDYIDYSDSGSTGLGIRIMDGYYDYSYSTNYAFYNQNLLITCTRLFDKTNSVTPKKIDEFSSYFYSAFEPMLLLQNQNYDFTEEDCMINHFLSKKYEGTVMTKSGESLSAKAYTFVCNGWDYIVIAVVREENDENIRIMKNDIDVFMNNLGIVK